MSERFVCSDMVLYKHCIYILFVLSCVTDCFTVCLSLWFVDGLLKTVLPSPCNLIYWTRLIIRDHFSGQVERSTGCVCVCVRTITFERNDLWPRNVALHVGKIRRLRSQVKVQGHRRKTSLQWSMGVWPRVRAFLHFLRPSSLNPACARQNTTN